MSSCCPTTNRSSIVMCSNYAEEYILRVNASYDEYMDNNDPTWVARHAELEADLRREHTRFATSEYIQSLAQPDARSDLFYQKHGRDYNERYVDDNTPISRMHIDEIDRLRRTGVGVPVGPAFPPPGRQPTVGWRAMLNNLRGNMPQAPSGPQAPFPEGAAPPHINEENYGTHPFSPV